MVTCNKVIHEAYIRVEEKGTEAGAATIIDVKPISAARPFAFRADHPFLFIIRDGRTGSILFMGSINQPKDVFDALDDRFARRNARPIPDSAAPTTHYGSAKEAFHFSSPPTATDNLTTDFILENGYLAERPGADPDHDDQEEGPATERMNMATTSNRLERALLSAPRFESNGPFPAANLALPLGFEIIGGRSITPPKRLES